MRPVTCSLVLSALSVACADAPTTPPQPSLPAFDAAHAPPASGPNVVRAPGLNVLALGGDPANPLAVIAGLEGPIADFCSPAGAPVSDHFFQLVFTPAGRVQVAITGREVALQVFEYGAGIVTDACQLIGAPLIATGTGTVRFGVHDAAGGPGGTTVHATVRGIVNLTGGGQARLLATAQVTVRPDKSLVIDNERVTLTPR
jgi:hypothetical protein